MRTKFFLSAALALVMGSTALMAQQVTERFQVAGNCGMCKTKIEKAAKEAGASKASWNEDSKELAVSFASGSTNVAQIQQKIAEVGYDNAGARATDAAYDKLHGCCKYERTAVRAQDCCKDGVCTSPNKAECCKTGKCTATAKADCCKDGVCTSPNKAECCKSGTCTNGSAAKKDCSKSEQCSKDGQGGKSCCAKS